MDRAYNFSAGPSMLPLEILESAQKDMLNFQGCGMSIIEVSHRSKVFEGVLNKSLADLKELLAIPSNFKVFYMQGGGSMQFACVPLNMLKDKTSTNYLVTGVWGEKAAEEAAKYSTVNIVGTGKPLNYTTIPEVETWNIDPDAAYFYYCTNETVHGLELELTDAMIEKIGNMPIVADMSSNILSKRIDYQKHAVIYAAAQKNAGPSGFAIMIVREDILGHALKITPTMCDWKLTADNNSMYNTPNTYSIYMSGLYFDYVKRHGGVAAFTELSSRKSSIIYEVIDNSEGFYIGHANRLYRSTINIPFFIRNNELVEKFVAEANEIGLKTLAGFKTLGGLRASLYNGMPIEGVLKLAEFMRDFQTRNS